jgi:cysteinyl-tRNA synthetase
MIRLYSTLTRKKENFKPQRKNKVGMYVCGPTVYDFIHIGNARTFVAFDVIRRYLEYKGYKVTFISNITDVGHLTEDEAREDRIVKKAKKEKVSPKEIAKLYTKEFLKDMTALNIRKPTYLPRATKHIKEMIKLVQTLIKRGYAYETNSNVYFSIKKFKDYGKLSGVSLKQLKAGARVKAGEGKRNPGDFALWIKAPKEHLMKWKSPWGVGYPGWHIECSVMAIKYYGKTLDIHGGGRDLIFPHHENEIAQSEAANNKPFVKYWLHTGWLLMKGEKMAKSVGNILTAREIIKKYGAGPLRYFLVSSQYRTDTNLTEKTIKSAKLSYERLRETKDKLKFRIMRSRSGPIDKRFLFRLGKQRDKFIHAMDDDFNTPKALASIFDLMKEINKYKGNGRATLKKTLDIFLELTNVLGLLEKEEERIPEKIMKLVKEREKARKEKDYKRSDKVRIQLKKEGWEVQDTSHGPKVKRL